MTEQTDITKEKTTTEQTVIILIMRLNQSLAKLDALNKFPATNKPHVIELYRDVYQDMFELSRLTRATLSENLLKKLSNWGNLPLSSRDIKFTKQAIELTELIYDELSDSGMINIRVRKTATFPIEFYLNRIRDTP